MMRDQVQSASTKVIDKISSEQRSEYLKLLEIHNNNRIDYNTRKWETMKYFQSIVLAFLGATVIAFTTGVDRGLFCKPFILSLGFTIVVALLPLVAALAARFGIENLRRESDLLYAEEAQVFKLAKLLELDGQVSERLRWIPGDENLFMPKWREWKYGIKEKDVNIDIREWISLRTRSHRFKKLSDWLFGIEASIAILALVLVIFVFMAGQSPIGGSGKICIEPRVGSPSLRLHT